MKILSILLFTALAAISGFGQEAKASMSPTEVVAGKNITITLTVDIPPSVEATQISVLLAPREQKDNPNQFGVPLIAKKTDPKTYSNTVQVPFTAKGVWYIKGAFTSLDSGSADIALTDRPELLIKPVEVIFPKTGKVAISVP